MCTDLQIFTFHIFKQIMSTKELTAYLFLKEEREGIFFYKKDNIVIYRELEGAFRAHDLNKVMIVCWV